MKARITIDAGHGYGSHSSKQDVGAVGYTKDGTQVREADVTLSIAKRVADILDQHGFDVGLSRPDTNYVGLSDRSKFSNQRDDDYFVSIHCNFYNSKAEGIETFHYPSSTKGKRMAAHVQAEMCNEFPSSPNRGIKSGTFSVLRGTAAPAILAECEFIDSKAELLADTKTHQRFAEAIAKGIINYTK